MQPLRIRDVVLGEGIPKICVSLISKTKKEIIEEAQAIHEMPVELVEWRADWFDEIENPDSVLNVLNELRTTLIDIPLLFTFRTKNEGGERYMDLQRYAALIHLAAASGVVDLIDIEISLGDAAVKEMIEDVHALGVKVMGSHHDFHKTPDQDVLVSRLCKMQELGADILKIAVMPKNKRDVVTLLEASVIMSEKYATRPIVAISLSDMGNISRVTGEFFGSAITFGALNIVSAPGQIGVNKLSELLESFHNAGISSSNES